ncbi:MAG: hypothetical protein HOP33_14710 [Verrucomicrobia bacterium]|nr:hypothetical protein [Verrucomicrobiota bacterium]
MSAGFRATARRWVGWVFQPPYIALIAIPLLAMAMLFHSGFRSIAILLREERTTATVTRVEHPSHGRVAVYYSYKVDGRAYEGAGLPYWDPDRREPYTNGSTYEIRYSKIFPSVSMAQNPTDIFGQFLFGCGFLLWADYLATRNRAQKNIQKA